MIARIYPMRRLLSTLQVVINLYSHRGMRHLEANNLEVTEVVIKTLHALVSLVSDPNIWIAKDRRLPHGVSGSGRSIAASLGLPLLR